jgi:hypothetical protein
MAEMLLGFLKKIDPPFDIDFTDGKHGMAIYFEGSKNLIVKMDNGEYMRVYDLSPSDLQKKHNERYRTC